MSIGFLEKILILILFVPVAGVFAEPCNKSESRELTHKFYITVQREGLGSFPDSKDYEKIKPFLASKLENTLKLAVLAGEKSHAKNELPPYENSFLSSYAEGHTNFSVAEAKIGLEATKVKVLLQYSSPPELPSVVDETNYVVIVKEDSECKIADILFSADAYSEPTLQERINAINSYEI
jgi:hypothetical protein